MGGIAFPRVDLDGVVILHRYYHDVCTGYVFLFLLVRIP